ncbi:MAG: hypothetical protein DCC75_04530 [Proteobacteria bacterium]|nr:MAG: hypothetical protein DCC75_04530 [Pseudomonadota bacterium]
MSGVNPEIEPARLLEALGLRSDFLLKLPESEVRGFLQQFGRYMRLARHPDLGGDPQDFALIQECCDSLSPEFSIPHFLAALEAKSPIQREITLLAKKLADLRTASDELGSGTLAWIQSLAPRPDSLQIQTLRDASIRVLTVCDISQKTARLLEGVPKLADVLESARRRTQYRDLPWSEAQLPVGVEIEYRINSSGEWLVTQFGEESSLPGSITGPQAFGTVEIAIQQGGSRNPLEYPRIASDFRIDPELRAAFLPANSQFMDNMQLRTLRPDFGRAGDHRCLCSWLIRSDYIFDFVPHGLILSVTMAGRRIWPSASESEMACGRDLSATALDQAATDLCKMLEAITGPEYPALERYIDRLKTESNVWSEVRADPRVIEGLERALGVLLREPECHSRASHLASDLFGYKYAGLFPERCGQALALNLMEYMKMDFGELCKMCAELEAYSKDEAQKVQESRALSQLIEKEILRDGGRERLELLLQSLGADLIRIDHSIESCLQELPETLAGVRQAIAALKNVADPKAFGARSNVQARVSRMAHEALKESADAVPELKQLFELSGFEPTRLISDISIRGSLGVLTTYFNNLASIAPELLGSEFEPLVFKSEGLDHLIERLLTLKADPDWLREQANKLQVQRILASEVSALALSARDNPKMLSYLRTGFPEYMK